MANRGGVDLGGTKIQTVIVDAKHKVLGQARRPTPTTGTPADVKDAIAAALVEAADGAGTKTSALSGIGVGSPGEIDPETGAVSQARNLPGWEGTYPLAEALAESCGAPAAVGNDVQVATDAEFQLGAGKKYGSILGVFWGTGVGGGLVLDGKPWLGRGAAGEIGHVVVRLNGARCPCGRRGCMEAYAGRAAMEAKARREVARGRKTNLFEIMEKRGRERLTSGIWARAVKKADQHARDHRDQQPGVLGEGRVDVGQRDRGEEDRGRDEVARDHLAPDRLLGGIEQVRPDRDEQHQRVGQPGQADVDRIRGKRRR